MNESIEYLEGLAKGLATDLASTEAEIELKERVLDDLEEEVAQIKRDQYLVGQRRAAARKGDSQS